MKYGLRFTLSRALGKALFSVANATWRARNAVNDAANVVIDAADDGVDAMRDKARAAAEAALTRQENRAYDAILEADGLVSEAEHNAACAREHFQEVVELNMELRADLDDALAF